MGALGSRHFAAFWVTATISLLGDQLTFIALPWLVLKLTDSAGALGTVLALAAVPRAAFILLGGAMSDRMSPVVVLWLSNAVRAVLMLGLAYSVHTSAVDLTGVYFLALAFGLADAFMFPSSTALIPRLLGEDQLVQGNALFTISAQLTTVVGPVLAGVLIVFGADAVGAGDLDDGGGLVLVFLLDALTFLPPLFVLLWLPQNTRTTINAESETVWGSIYAGLRYCWASMPIRSLAILIATLSLIFRGPFLVGIPVYANDVSDFGATAVGIIFSVLGLGAVVGAVVAGVTEKVRDTMVGTLMLCSFLMVSLALIAMALTDNLWIVCAPIFVTGVVDGYSFVVLSAFVQRRTDPEFMGRVMSVLMFSNLGLIPISTAVAGFFIETGLGQVLLSTAAVLLVVSVVGLSLPNVRRLGLAHE